MGMRWRGAEEHNGDHLASSAPCSENSKSSSKGGGGHVSSPRNAGSSGVPSCQHQSGQRPPCSPGPLDAQWPTSHKSCSGTLRTCRLRPHEQVNYHPLPAGQRKIPPAGSPTMMVSLTSKWRTSRARLASMPSGSSAADNKCLCSNPTGVQARNPPHTRRHHRYGSVR